MNEVIGVVAKVHSKQLASGTYWSFVLDGDDQWYRHGRDKPAFDAGYKIKFTPTQDKYGVHADPKGVEFKEGEAPPQREKAASGGGNKSDYQQRQQYWEDKEQRDIVNQKRISYQAATNTAIALVELALKTEAIKLPATKNKAFPALQEIVGNEADRIYVQYAIAPDRHDELVSGEEQVVVTDAEEEEAEEAGGNTEW